MILPIDSHLDKIQELVLNHSVVILKASPGSGKTTRVPPFLASKIPNKMIVLEPRRLAAKMSAERIADETKTVVGDYVGYMFRFEKVISPKTQIIFQTEGNFLKQLLHNPTLKEVDLVVLDEFHERHLETDIALAYLENLQRTLRPDLKIVIMSATLDLSQLQKYFPNAPTYEVINPPYPLEIHYLENKPSILNLNLEKKVLMALETILNYEGDILIFLPGKKEIENVFETLERNLKGNFRLLILHGQLSKEQQKLVVQDMKERKIILSTNIAESSITIPGVRNVIDSGEHKEIEHSNASGLSVLKTTKISRSSTIQRAGRANRQGPGVAFKLFSSFDEENRKENHKPEILRSDLSKIILDLLSLGIKIDNNIENLKFLDIPDFSSIASAKNLLFQLGAIDANNKLTEIGKYFTKLPLGPRQSKIILESMEQYLETAINFVLQNENKNEKQALKHRIYESLKTIPVIKNNKTFEQILLSANLDRLLKARKQQKDFISSSGEIFKTGKSSGDIDFNHELWVGLDFSPNNEILHLIPIEEFWLYDITPFPIEENIEINIDQNGHLQAYEKIHIGSLIISGNKKKVQIPNRETAQIMKPILAKSYHEWLASDSYARYSFLEQFTKTKFSKLPLDQWLTEWAEQLCSFTEEDKLHFLTFIETQIPLALDPDEQFPINEYAPKEISLTDKRKVPIHYRLNDVPFVESYIQDFYGLSQTPQIAKGQVNLKVHLLGPHKRALQVTSDLMSFWNGAYKEMYKELSRDYPRHYWPTDPKNSKPILLKKNA